MPKLDETRPFLACNIAILTVSDTRDAASDKSGNALAEMIARDGHKVAARAIVKDDVALIQAQLKAWIADPTIGTSALQSRATGGVAGGTYLFALPGSPSACRDGWEDILKWQLDNRHRPCNLVELMPRLQEHLTVKPKATV
jgi:molybdenum cofactor biosynthesis protein B